MRLSARLPDSCHYTPSGRRLLVSLGVVEPDPLRVAAEEWLEMHTGCRTPATRRVREALGPPWSAEMLTAAEKFKDTPWKTEAQRESDRAYKVRTRMRATPRKGPIA